MTQDPHYDPETWIENEWYEIKSRPRGTKSKPFQVKYVDPETGHGLAKYEDGRVAVAHAKTRENFRPYTIVAPAIKAETVYYDAATGLTINKTRGGITITIHPPTAIQGAE